MTKMIQINPTRLDYLLKAYDLSKSGLLDMLNKGRKRLLTEADVFSSEIRRSVLKRIDKLFGRSLSFYTDPYPLKRSREASIFFRKTDFNGTLEFSDRRRILEIENEVCYMGGLMTLSKFKLERKLDSCKVADSPQRIAYAMREIMPPVPTANDRDFLKQFIAALSAQNILVHEFIEQHNKVSWEGVFLAPYTIAIKRQQHALKREIFTLAHELGHYLLNIEEVDVNVFQQHSSKQKAIENWCNTFAFYFLAGEASQELPALFNKQQNIFNDDIEKFSRKHKLSRKAIYTHLSMTGKISYPVYINLSKSLDAEYEQRTKEREAAREAEKERLKKLPPEKRPQIPPAQPIHAPLAKDIYRQAFFEGVIEDVDIVKRFRPNKRQIERGFVDKLLYGDKP